MSITILYIAAAMAAGLLFNRFAKLISLPNVTGYLVAGQACLTLSRRMVPRR